MEQTVALDLAELARRWRPVFRKHRIEKALLFGSHARGEATRHSDLDLILIKRTPVRFLDRLKGLLLELNRMSPGPAVEALVYTPRELKQMRGRKFIETALAESKVIYESSQGKVRGRSLARDRA